MRKLFKSFDPDLLCLLVLLVLGLAAYSNSFFASFHYDDLPMILENGAIFDLTNLRKIYSSFSARFLTYLTLAFNYRLSKFDPTSYHIFNFFIHYFAAFFLYFLFLETLKTPALKALDLKFPKRLAAFFSAGIFLLHPLQTQSVTYIIQRAESMAGMFYLGALFFYVRARLSSEAHAKGGYYSLMLLCGLGAAFSKETAVTLPAMIVVFEVCLFDTSFKGLLKKKAVLFSAIPAGVVLAYKLGPLVQRNFFYDPGTYITRKQYLFTQFSVLVTYLRLFFWPANQNIDWDYPVAVTFFNMRTFSSVFVLLLLLLLAALLYRKFRLFSVGIIAFFVTLAPTSSIIPILDVIYEHRMYLAVAFLAMACVQIIFQGLPAVLGKSPRLWQASLLMVIIVTLPLLGGLTHARNQVWLNELFLWRDAVQKSPNKARPHIKYGNALYYYGFGDLKNAKREFEIAKKLCPECPRAYHNLAFVYRQEGDYEKAIALDLEALRLKADYGDALYQLGKMYKELNQWHSARIYLERLIDTAPRYKFVRAYLDLLDVYLQMDLENEGLRLAEVLNRMPDGLPGLDYYRGLAFYKVADFGRAKSFLSKKMEDRSTRTSSRFLLGQIYYVEGEYGKAREMFLKVLEDNPWSAAAHYNLAILLAKSNRSHEAIDHLQHARVVDPFAVDTSIKLIKTYGYVGYSAKQLDLIRRLLGLRPDSEEYSFLKSNGNKDLNKTLKDYTEKFLCGNTSASAQKAKAIIATLQGDFPKAIEIYKGYVQTITDKRVKDVIEKEVNRLEGVLRGREPLKIEA